MKRLLEGDGSELEQGLLDALRLERPSAELEQRMRAAIGLGPIAAAVPEPSSPTAAAVPAGKTVGWGTIAAGAVAAAVVVGGAFFLSQGGSDKGPLPASAPAPAPVQATPPSDPGLSAPARAPDLHVDDLPQEAPKSRPQPAHVAPTSASLREEIRLIDSARVAVKKNESARALGILEQYARRFPDGAFKEEARVLRAEARKNR